MMMILADAVVPACVVQLSVPEYQSFLGFMCPNYQQWGVYPPAGADPAQCPRPVFGTYDDHDSGWNNGNGR
jgi:alkaline phosphatase D